MVKQRNGVIVNVSSESGLEGSGPKLLCRHQKAALNSFTRSGRKSWANTAFVWWALHPAFWKNRTADPEYEEALARTRNITVEQLREGYTQERDPIGRSGRLKRSR